jgi:Fe-S oxidoreductase
MVQKSKLVLKRMKPELGNKFTYHDPCHLARLGGIFEEPRALLAQLGNIVEMKNNRYEADCCGSGGGVRAAYPELSTAICKRRIKAAQATGANLLVTACPFCEDRFMSVGGIEVKDIIELLYSAVIT